MAASLLSESAGDEPTASVGVGAGLAIVRPVMSWKGRFNSKILLKWAKSIAQIAKCPLYFECVFLCTPHQQPQTRVARA